jgi:hypothetical protein
MKAPSNELLHRFNNKIGLLVSSLEAMSMNMDDHEYCKEVLTEIINIKEDYTKVLADVRTVLEGKAL